VERRGREEGEKRERRGREEGEKREREKRERRHETRGEVEYVWPLGHLSFFKYFFMLQFSSLD
jgi:hypothetical protein